MELQTLLSSYVAVKVAEWETRRELRKLSDRALADIGIDRDEIGRLARSAARGVSLPRSNATSASPGGMGLLGPIAVLRAS